MQNSIVVLSALALLYPCGNCTAQPMQSSRPATFVVNPNPALMDDRIAVRLTGLPPNRSVMIRAASRDQRGCWWRSFAVFVTQSDGSLDLSKTAAVNGTYTGLDGMGLFWSMRPDEVRQTPAFFSVVDWFKPVVTQVEAALDGKVVANSQVIRRFAAPGVRSEFFSRSNIAGILYRPRDDCKHPAVILLGGSEGGFPTPEGPMLASRGFTVLALAYFGTNGLPPSMQKIPVEYFGRAISEMRALPGNEGTAIFVVGGSRGGEAALIIGSTYPEVDGVVAISGSHVRWEGATAKLFPGGPAWTYQGKPLPYVPFHIGPTFAIRYLWAGATGGPISLRPMFTDSLRRAVKDDVEIPVERIRGPVLLGSGGDDRKWPSAVMSKRVLDRLRRNRHPYSDEYCFYEGAGHWLPSAYLPTGGLRGYMAEEIGGTPAGTAAAQRDWWPRVLGFLAARDAQSSRQ